MGSSAWFMTWDYVYRWPICYVSGVFLSQYQVMNSSEPLVSIVTPVYNGEQFIRECVESVLAQTYQNWEYLIQDNFSTDGTPDILEEFRHIDPRIRIERNPELLPAIANWNLAFSKISVDSTYAQMLHADDSLHPECLSRKVALAQKHSNMGLVGSLTEADGDIWGDGLERDQQAFNGKEIARRTLLGHVYPFLTPSVLLIRSEIVLNRKPFYADQIHSDVSACYEILREWDFGFLHSILSNVGIHEDNITATVAKPLNRLLISNLDLLLTYGPEFLNQEEMERAVEARLQNYYRFLAKSSLEGRNAEFWSFHEKAMQELNQPIDKLRLVRTVVKELLNQPRASLSRIKHRILNTTT